MLERDPQLCPATVNPAAHRTELNAQRRGDFLVGEALDIAQHDCRPVFRWQCPQRRLDIAVEMRVVEGLRRGRLTTCQPVRFMRISFTSAKSGMRS